MSINITSLRSYLSQVVANQVKATVAARQNQYNSVGSIATTANYMTINPATGTTENPPPQITPITVNTPTAYISTNNSNVSVTSEGSNDTIFTSQLVQITNIEDVTNAGYTKDNTVANLYDSLSTNYWNPQVNQGAADPYYYRLIYHFSGTQIIYKFTSKTNNTYPGFTNIRIIDPNDLTNYVDVKPATDTNNQYLNTSVALLLDDSGTPFFTTDSLIVDFSLDPAVQPNTYYQYGPAVGALFNDNATNVYQLRAGNYINSNLQNCLKLEWTTEYIENSTTTATGTSNNNNYYVTSPTGLYRIVQDSVGYSLSLDSGNTWTKYTLTTSAPMRMSESGQYIITGALNKIYKSNTFGQSFTVQDVTYVLNPNLNYPWSSISRTGQYQFLNSEIFKYLTVWYIQTYRSSNSGESFSLSSLQYSDAQSFETAYVVNSLTQENGTFIVIVNYRTNSPGTTAGVVKYAYKTLVSSFIITTRLGLSANYLNSFEKNNNSDPSLDGKFKTGFGMNNWDGIWGNPVLVSTTNDFNLSQAYVSFTNTTVFSDYYTRQYTANEIAPNTSAIKLSADGTTQIAIVTWYFSKIPGSQNYVTSYYTTNSATSWSKSATFPTLLNTLTNIVATDDLSFIMACGGQTYTYNGQSRTDPICYISTDFGNNWILSSSINPASSFVSTNFFSVNIVSNKTYFQIKDLQQNQVLGVSDNGFNMTKDLRVTNSDAFVLGGTLTVGPDAASALLNDYDLNVDGTISARNIVLLSDQRFKTILGPVSGEESFNKLLLLEIVKYKYKDRPNDNREFVGMIAQQVQNIFPNAVDVNSSSYETPDGIIAIDDVYSINYPTVISYLISAIQHTQQRIQSLENFVTIKTQNL
jgi:hypothetical protein